jgi:predicted nucleic acid-binding protein
VAPFLPETSYTIVPAFVDTNILVYAEDRDAGQRIDDLTIVNPFLPEPLGGG